MELSKMSLYTLNKLIRKQRAILFEKLCVKLYLNDEKTRVEKSDCE